MPETLTRAGNPVLDQPPSPARPPAAGTGQSRPRPGFRHPDSARRCAAAFLADGITAADVREDADPGDMLLAELADVMDGPDRGRRAPGVIRDYWMAALKLYATGRTAADLRAQAADPAWVAGLAYVDGITPSEERAEMLRIARAIEELTAAGLTPEQAYFLAGLDRDLGPYEDYAGFSRLPEAAA